MDSWPNQEALNKALNIYRVSMRSFIIFHLKKIPGMNVEDVVIDSVGDWRADEIDRLLIEPNRKIESVIDINDFPHLVNKNWGEAFERTLNDDKTFRNQLWLIVECRNADWAHPPEGDADFESTRAHLFLIADVLGKINKSDAKDRVEVIRNELDDTTERLADAEECLKKMEAENAEHKKSLAEVEKHLETAKLEKSKEEVRNSLSEEVRDYQKKYPEKRRNIFYRRIAEIQNLIEAEDWRLKPPKFNKENCSFWLTDKGITRVKRVFGILLDTFLPHANLVNRNGEKIPDLSIKSNPPRIFAPITEEEAKQLEHQHGCEFWGITERNIYYNIPDDITELRPVLEFAYNKHRGQ